MWKTLKEVNAAGTTVILTTHYLEEAESLCRNLAIIDRGVIIEQGPMKTLLAKLDIEGFLLDIDGPLPATLPQIAGATLLRGDDHTLDIDMPRAMDLNGVFAALDTAGIRVRSMRTKTNRLEELFVRLTGGSGHMGGGSPKTTDPAVKMQQP
jgi:ABC-2 type transport system ATP-binding protein